MLRPVGSRAARVVGSGAPGSALPRRPASRGRPERSSSAHLPAVEARLGGDRRQRGGVDAGAAGQGGAPAGGEARRVGGGRGAGRWARAAGVGRGTRARRTGATGAAAARAGREHAAAQQSTGSGRRPGRPR